MVQISEPYMLASAYRMVQISKPCRHMTFTMRAYATLINAEFLRHGETHLALYTTEVAHCWSCKADQMHYVWFAISMRRLFWLEIGAHVKSVTPSTMFPSTLIDASSGPVPRIWTLGFCQQAFIPNVLRLPGNLRILLTTDHQVSWTVTAPILSTLDYARFTAWIACWGRSQHHKQNSWSRLAANVI